MITFRKLIFEQVDSTEQPRHRSVIYQTWNEFHKARNFFRVSSGQGKVREIPDLPKVREKSGNFVEGQGKNEYLEKSGKVREFAFSAI